MKTIQSAPSWVLMELEAGDSIRCDSDDTPIQVKVEAGDRYTLSTADRSEPTAPEEPPRPEPERVEAILRRYGVAERDIGACCDDLSPHFRPPGSPHPGSLAARGRLLREPEPVRTTHVLALLRFERDDAVFGLEDGSGSASVVVPRQQWTAMGRPGTVESRVQVWLP